MIIKKKLVLLESEMQAPNGNFLDYLIESTIYFQDKFNIIWFLNKNCDLKESYIPKNVEINKDKFETLITSKDNIREQMIKQKNLNPNNFYVLLYFKSNKVIPSFSHEHNDQELVSKSVVDFEDEIKNNSEDNVNQFIRDVVNFTTYSSKEDIDKLQVIFNNKNKPLISFYSKNGYSFI